MPSKRWRSRALVLAIAGLCVTPGTAVSLHSVEVPPAGATPTTVRLITGDTVVLGAVPTVRPGPGRDGVRFDIHRSDGRLTVVPSDAQGLIGQGRLDRRLFDVNQLMNSTAAKTDGVGLIVSGGGAGTVRSLPGLSAARELPLIEALAFRASGAALPELWRKLHETPEMRVSLDGLRKPSLEHSVPMIGAPSVWESGNTGKGVRVAVVDTGIDHEHPDLVGRVTARRSFISDDHRDTVGHGTHVASTIAGTGAASQGRYKGVAPDAELLDAQVCIAIGCPESAIVAGLGWVGEQGAKIANLSLGGPDHGGPDPVKDAVTALTENHGVLVVAAAGNSGQREKVSSPASAKVALAVGAVDKSGEIAGFSSRGPGGESEYLKPEITAPGVNISAARSRHAEGSGDYVAHNGTSMAAPHVAGAAALLVRGHPSATPEELKAMLTSSAVPNERLGAHDQGSGRVDVARAARQTVTSGPGVEFGVQNWPHHDDTPVSREITYRNPGPVPVVLNLSMTTLGPDGKPSPAGLFRLTTDSVTVPAGGSAAVSVTADTRIHAPDGVHSGRITATAADTRITTPFAVDREHERYTLSVDPIGTDGNKTPVEMAVHGLDNSEPITIRPGDTAARLPKGRYSMTVRFTDESVVMMNSTVVLDRDQVFTVDARNAGPIITHVPDPLAADDGACLDSETRSPRGWSLSTFCLPADTKPVLIGSFGAVAPGPDFSVHVMATKVNRDQREGVKFYNIASHFPGIAPRGINKKLTKDDLAVIEVAYFRHGNEITDIGYYPIYPDSYSGLLSVERVEVRSTFLVNSSPGVRWTAVGFNNSGTDDSLSTLASVSKNYKPGEKYQENWNNAVFSPCMSSPAVAHTGVTLDFFLKLACDGSGHYGNRSGRSRVTVERDGRRIADIANVWGLVSVEPGRGRYRLAAEGSGPAGTTLSTRLTSVWTFSLDQGTPEALTYAPMWSVGFQPTLNLDNEAPAGSPMSIPVLPMLSPGVPASTIERLGVEYSFDDGATWHSAELDTVDGRRTIKLTNPDADFVSLRSTLVDSDGNTAEQTIIRAYAVR